MLNDKRDPRTDPIYGDIVGHKDGGKMYVEARSQKMVLVRRKARMTDSPDTRNMWMRLSTYRRQCNREVFHVAD